jgi:hypothetical protein
MQDVRRIGDEELLLQNLSVLKDHHAVQVLGAVGDGLEVGSEGFIEVGGGCGARERAGRAGAGSGQRDCKEKGDTFHTFGFSTPNILILNQLSITCQKEVNKTEKI